MPIVKRKRQWDVAIVDEIRYLRQTCPNLDKDKLHPLLEDFCAKHRLPHPSISSIGILTQEHQRCMHTASALIVPCKMNWLITTSMI
jgi:hypothetical protein